MENLDELVTTNDPVVESGVDYIGTIKNLKENTVSKSVYEASIAENKRLLEALANGDYMSNKEEELKPEVDVDALRRDLFGSNNLSNREYWEKTIALRDELIARGERDPFLPYGHEVVVSDSDYEIANRVGNVMKEIINEAAGSDDIFNNEYQRRVVDSISRR